MIIVTRIMRTFKFRFAGHKKKMVVLVKIISITARYYRRHRDELMIDPTAEEWLDKKETFGTSI